MSHREDFTQEQLIRSQALSFAISFTDLGKFGVASKNENWPQVEDTLSVAEKFYNFLMGEQNSKKSGPAFDEPGPNIVASPVGIGPADNSSDR